MTTRTKRKLELEIRVITHLQGNRISRTQLRLLTGANIQIGIIAKGRKKNVPLSSFSRTTFFQYEYEPF